MQVLKLFSIMIYTALKFVTYPLTNIFAQICMGINFLKCISYIFGYKLCPQVLPKKNLSGSSLMNVLAKLIGFIAHAVHLLLTNSVHISFFHLLRQKHFKSHQEITVSNFFGETNLEIPLTATGENKKKIKKRGSLQKP